MTALKGLVHLKREVIRIDDSLKALEKKFAHLNDAAAAVGRAVIQDGHQAATRARPPVSVLNADMAGPAEVVPSLRLGAVPHVSERYRQVLELAASGLLIPDIAAQLNISQDAVNMVLSTHAKGGQR